MFKVCCGPVEILQGPVIVTVMHRLAFELWLGLEGPISGILMGQLPYYKIVRSQQPYRQITLAVGSIADKVHRERLG